MPENRIPLVASGKKPGSICPSSSLPLTIRDIAGSHLCGTGALRRARLISWETSHFLIFENGA
jgi:hypothetical protein